MQAFNRLPGFQHSAPGLEHQIWRRLPAALLWGTLLPLLLALANHLLTPDGAGSNADAAAHGAQLLRDFTLLGLVVLHWTLMLTLAIGCFIVRVMKGPAYVADAYPEPVQRDAPATKT